ncbi:villin-4-like isoform X2 [Cynara cardunculus var. scolymus]|uniref:villin-4-like isoform X2 n=1 Tax=Cynara cardunculus var. scolymus TaxID=59895 RepID=UPI000D6230C2|nr:villin-4-like isoform X2 [Cynara cardunculus var. scolymus]
MSVSMRDLDPAFQGAGQKAGIEVWRIENFKPVVVPQSSYGKFFTGDSYVILKTIALKSGALRHDIHYWLGKDTSQDEAGAAALKTVELDAALGGRAVQYREVQGHETERFLSYFKPCIIPQEGGIASGFKHAEPEEHKNRMFTCQGKHVVHVKEVPFARSSLNHDDIFILDTANKIFQFNGSNSCIQERAKALEVVQHIKDTYHDGKCDIATVEDGKLMSDAETGEFWGFFGGFAPLPRKTATDDAKNADALPTQLFCVEKGQVELVAADSLKKELLDTSKCYLLDCGAEIYVWMGRGTSLDERKAASGAAEEYLRSQDRLKSHIIRVIENFETVTFRSKFEAWPQSTEVAVSEDGRGKVAALLKRQGVNVWRVNGQDKTLLSVPDQSKFYSGECYIFQYTCPGEDQDECLVGTWFGKQSVEEDRNSATSQANKMVESLKFLASQLQIYEGSEPILFFAIFQSFLVLKGGLSDGYKNFISGKELPDETYKEDGVALFRVQGSGPENMQAIQVEPVASSLNSSYCYILHRDSSVFSWIGNLTTPEVQELVERQLDVIKPNMQSKLQKEGSESEQFWEILGGKCEYPSQKIARDAESDPHLFSCTFSKGDLKVTEIYNFNQDDLMTEDIFILDCHSSIFVWVGQQVDQKIKTEALVIGQKFLERDFLLEKLSLETPIYIITEGSEPQFFTRFFTWDSSKSAMHGNSFQRKLSILKNGGRPTLNNKPKRRTPVSHGGRSVATEKPQRSRSVSFSPDRVRVRGRSPAFNALASTFENANARNLSTPPPLVRKPYPKSGATDSASRSTALASLTATFEQPPREPLMPRSVKPRPKSPPKTDSNSKENLMSSKMEALTIQEDVKENEVEDEEGLTLYPYERLTTVSTNPAADIDVTKRETYLSSAEFRDKFGMTKEAFYKLPKWKQNKLKMALQLF